MTRSGPVALALPLLLQAGGGDAGAGEFPIRLIRRR